MKRVETIIIVSLAFILGQFVIPWLFHLVNIPIWVTYIITFLSVMPIPIIMYRDLKGIPYIRIVVYCIVAIPVLTLIMYLFVGTMFQQVAGFALLLKLPAIATVFGVSFVVYHYLNFSKRGAIFLILFAIFTYLEPILGSYTTMVSMILRLLSDYTNNTPGVDWNIMGPMGVASIYTYTIQVLAFISLVVAFDGLMEEKKLSSY